MAAVLDLGLFVVLFVVVVVVVVVMVEVVVRGVVGLLAMLLVVEGSRAVVVLVAVEVALVVEVDSEEGDFLINNRTGVFLEILFHQGKADIVLVLRIE